MIYDVSFEVILPMEAPDKGQAEYKARKLIQLYLENGTPSPEFENLTINFRHVKCNKEAKEGLKND